MEEVVITEDQHLNIYEPNVEFFSINPVPSEAKRKLIVLQITDCKDRSDYSFEYFREKFL